MTKRQILLLLFVATSLLLNGPAEAQVQPQLQPRLLQEIQQRPQALLRLPIQRIVVNPYTTMLRRRLTAELHFVKKVCDPTPEQFEQIHLEGLDAVESLAIDYSELQRKRTDVNRWPEPRAFLCDVLHQAVAKAMPLEAATKYKEEIEAREESLQEANVAVVLNVVDQRTVLDADQMQKISEKLRRDWNPDWSSGTVMFMYPQYAVLPNSDVLRPFLSPLQQQLWSYRPTRRNVRLSWQLLFGSNELFNSSLPEFPEPLSRIEAAANKNAAPVIPVNELPQLQLLPAEAVR